MAATLTPEERALLEQVDAIICGNPFSDARYELDFLLTGAPRNTDRPTLVRMSGARVRDKLQELRIPGSNSGGGYAGQDAYLIESGTLFEVYHRFLDDMDEHIRAQSSAGDTTRALAIGPTLMELLTHYGFSPAAAARSIGVFYQLRRAFYFIDRGLTGNAPCMQQLRCRLWKNIFTGNVRLYERHLWQRMEDFSTLLLGDTGSGKGAAASAIGRSGFIPYNPKTHQFEENFAAIFTPLNLSQFPEALIESELFGHRKGAFTGAIDHHKGIFARCSAHGAIFLDEIGDVSIPIQIKLLQVLQERTFTPVGSHAGESFQGRVIAATNRPITDLRASGDFRDDFYYRLCSDEISLPTLQQRIAEDDTELELLLSSILTRMAGDSTPHLLPLVLDGIAASIPAHYAWPGNVRELEQATRRILLTGGYTPQETTHRTLPQTDPFLQAVSEGAFDARELTQHYCTRLYETLGSYGRVARRTGLDWRTVKRNIQHAPTAYEKDAHP